MNLVYSIRLLDGSLTLADNMRTNHVWPSDVESPHGVPKVLGVGGVVGICVVLSSRVFISTILKSNMVFIALCELIIVVIDPSRDSCTDVVIPS